MPLDADAQEVVDQIVKSGLPPIETLSPFNARQLPTAADAVMTVISKHPLDRAVKPNPLPVGAVTHRTIPGPDGDDLLLRVYTPPGDGPFPVLVYFHGGGFVIANLDTYDASCRAMTLAAGCVTLSVAYRLAPEHPFPAAVEDAFTAYQWALSNAAAVNGDATRVAVMGESAGGNLATVVSLLARDRGERLPLYQVLVYPVVDSNMETPSYREHAKAVPLSAAMMPWFFKYYLGDHPENASSPYVVPMHADLRGLPPAIVITDENDPLRSEGEAYARKLREAGVPVVYKHYDGVMHEFFGMAATVDKAKAATASVVKELRNAFAQPMPPMQGRETMDMPMRGAMPPMENAAPPQND